MKGENRITECMSVFLFILKASFYLVDVRLQTGGLGVAVNPIEVNNMRELRVLYTGSYLLNSSRNQKSLVQDEFHDKLHYIISFF